MNLNGEDSKYSCELHHGLHSWVGAATDGGYLGSDTQAFVSAVLSGAAGYYALRLTGDAGMGTDLTIQPGQDVHISGEQSLAAQPNWGSGSFVVAEQAQLSLSYLALSGMLTFAGTGSTISLTLLALPSGAWFKKLADSMKSVGGTTLELNVVTFSGIPDAWSSTTTSDDQGAMSYMFVSLLIDSLILGIRARADGENLRSGPAGTILCEIWPGAG
eukprot:SAG25_NODE_135_length_14397_cov_89.177857_7_plen_216_part_00